MYANVIAYGFEWFPEKCAEIIMKLLEQGLRLTEHCPVYQYLLLKALEPNVCLIMWPVGARCHFLTITDAIQVGLNKTKNMCKYQSLFLLILAPFITSAFLLTQQIPVTHQ